MDKESRRRIRQYKNEKLVDEVTGWLCEHLGVIFRSLAKNDMKVCVREQERFAKLCQKRGWNLLRAKRIFFQEMFDFLDFALLGPKTMTVNKRHRRVLEKLKARKLENNKK